MPNNKFWRKVQTAVDEKYITLLSNIQNEYIKAHNVHSLYSAYSVLAFLASENGILLELKMLVCHSDASL